MAVPGAETRVQDTEGDAFLFEGLDPRLVSQFPAPEPTPEETTKQLADELLYPTNRLTWDILDLVQALPPVNHDKLYEGLLLRPQLIGRTSFRFKRSGIAGTIDGYKEELRIDAVDNANSTNSLSAVRKFAGKNEALRGNSSFLPFQPGGLVKKAERPKSDASYLHRNAVGLFDTPQGLSRGLNIAGEDTEGITDLEEEKNADENEDVQVPSEAQKGTENEPGTAPFSDADVDGLVPVDYAQMRASTAASKEHKRNWAHVVDLDHKLDNFHDVVPNMAREWPFELDTFQQEAVYHLEQGDSVFVAAHTSAGKTVVAEYAIAMANRNMTKAIYTSPIKALSNQKFRDFKETFTEVDVGLITGDVQINPEANCLIMTTEILRSMLYKGADLIRDVEFVIFDEVHYVNDIERGVVWEEVIIMLPDHVKFILLSATVPNTYEFANWVGRTKQKDIYVILTPKRPVPLEIFVWAKQELYKTVDAQRKFSDTEFRRHKDALDTGKKGPPSITMGAGSRGGRGGTARGGNSIVRGGGRGGRGGRGGARGGGNFSRDGPNKSSWLELVQYLKQKSLLPAVVFVFLKKKCEEFADTLSSVDFCTAREKLEIHVFIDRAVSRLKKEDRELPQIVKIRDMLSRGIAVHHGGLLPIVKECIEILFARTLVKVLFATETFAMGLNLPTRTVVFNQLRKHDGRGFRNLLPGEFTQMSGRAGRRGLDATGTVIVMAYNEPLSVTDFKEVVLGTPTKLLSQFRLTYNMILNLLRIEALRVEEMIKHSFSENSTQTLLPEHQRQVEVLAQELASLPTDSCEICNLKGVSEAYQALTAYVEAYADIVEEVYKLPASRLIFFRPGRLMVFRDEKDNVLRFGFFVKMDANLGVLLLTFDHGKVYENHSATFQTPYVPNREYLKKTTKAIMYSGLLRVEKADLRRVAYLSRYVLRARISGILQNDAQTVNEAIEQIRVITKLQNKLDEVQFYLSIQLSLHELLEKRGRLLEQVNSQSFSCPNFLSHFQNLQKQDELQRSIASLQRLISDENLELLPDYEQRLAVLHELGFINDNNSVVLKGRVACEINSGWELVLTELVLDNFLGDFEPEEIVALLSCFVYEGRTNDDEPPCITPRLEKGRAKILEITDRLLKVYTANQVLLTADEQEFLERKRFALVNVVYEWARGLSFNEIMQISVEAEGTIVRVINRLDEVCREVKNAALIVGDSTLHSKMSDAQERIKRDIVFCASLYL